MRRVSERSEGMQRLTLLQLSIMKKRELLRAAQVAKVERKKASRLPVNNKKRDEERLWIDRRNV
jgi:hypothetical protein